MADTAAASYTLSQDATFKGRLQILMAKSAVAIVGEAQGTLTQEQWIKRQLLATDVLRNPLTWTNQFALAVCQNAAIVSTSADSDIEFTINSVWDDLAGVTGIA